MIIAWSNLDNGKSQKTNSGKDVAIDELPALGGDDKN